MTTSTLTVGSEVRRQAGSRFPAWTTEAREWLADRLPAHVCFHGLAVAELSPEGVWEAVGHEYLGGVGAFVDRCSAASSSPTESPRTEGV